MIKNSLRSSATGRVPPISRESIARRGSTDLTPVDDRSVQAEVRPLIEALNEHTSRIDRIPCFLLAQLCAICDLVNEFGLGHLLPPSGGRNWRR